MKKIEEKFCESLFKWQSEHFEGTQAELGNFFRVSQGQIAKIFSKQRCGDETWRRFVAKKIGYDYDTMIGVKKKDLENVIRFETIEDEEHYNATKKFSDKKTATKFNKLLVKIEERDPGTFKRLYNQVKFELSQISKKCKDKGKEISRDAASGEGQRR